MSVITSVPVDRIDGWVSRVAREKENAAQEGAAFKEREAA
jgi:hypothetical protein